MKNPEKIPPPIPLETADHRIVGLRDLPDADQPFERLQEEFGKITDSPEDWSGIKTLFHYATCRARNYCRVFGDTTVERVVVIMVEWMDWDEDREHGVPLTLYCRVGKLTAYEFLKNRILRKAEARQNDGQDSPATADQPAD